MALEVAKTVIDNKTEFKQYKLIEQLFIILPFMHSETQSDVEISVRLIDELI